MANTQFDHYNSDPWQIAQDVADKAVESYGPGVPLHTVTQTGDVQPDIAATNNNQIGDIDTSGTWTDGLEIGSPEWIDRQLKMDIVSGLMETGVPPQRLMGAFDREPVETGEGK